MKIIKLMLFMVFSINALAGEPINVTFDRNPVVLDESFQIIFTATDTPDSEPDFSPLAQDFEILGQSQSSNSSWVNGQSSKTIQWMVNVMARHAGTLTVPAIAFGSDWSQEATILVTASANNKPGNTDDDLFLEVEATPKNPYLQSQVLYKVRLYRRVDIAQASLSEPELSDAVVEKLGDDSNYNTQVNGVDYLVTERRYAMFPQKSGSAIIKPLVLTAEVMTGSRSGINGFFRSQITRTRKVSSKPVTLEVLPIASGFTGQHWLPAEQLVLKEEWSGDPLHMKAGEPLTRTLTLLAEGATVGQLPEINNSDAGLRLSEVKFYPDQPVLQEQKKAEGMVAFREEKIAIMPLKSGDFRLPAIEIPWFNAKSQSMEIAKIPETLITVSPESAEQSVVAPAVAQAPVETDKKVDQTNTEQQAPVCPTINQTTGYWPVIAGFLGFGWVLTGCFWLVRSRPRKNVTVPDMHQSSLTASIKRLKQACSENDAIAARDALLSWAREQYRKESDKIGVINLASIAAISEARLRDEILLLSRALYGREHESWQGKKFFQAFVENKARKKVAVSEDDKLEPIFRL